MPIDYAIARTTLAELFVATEAEYNERRPIAVEDEVSAASETVFRSASQGYREALLGCAIARLLDATSNIRFPYIQQGDNAYNGRTLDEEVINPLLVEKMIPCSRGPYLSMFRRDFKFIDEKVHGVRDKTSFRACLGYIAFLEQADEQRVEVLIKHLIQRFLELRERENVPIFRIARLSVEQFKVVFDDMLQVPSGGFIPMMFTIAMIKTIKECYRLAGVNTAGILGSKDYFVPRDLPSAFGDWREYRDYLTENLLPHEKAVRFFKKYADMDILYAGMNQKDNLYRVQISSVLTNDWEFIKIGNWEKNPEVHGFRQFKMGKTHAGHSKNKYIGAHYEP
jgi:hypothetical protein